MLVGVLVVVVVVAPVDDEVCAADVELVLVVVEVVEVVVVVEVVDVPVVVDTEKPGTTLRLGVRLGST